MEIIISNDDEEIGRKVSQLVIDCVKSKGNPILGLATGSSPVSTYKHLIKAYNEGLVSFKNVRTFNLDEYCGIPKTDKNSYWSFMHENLFNHIDIDENNIRVPNGNPDDFEAYCASYDKSIADAGGIDVQILGIGRNGHIGFNEPSDKFTEGTYKIKLTQSTIEANKKYFGSADIMPKFAITMGVGSITSAREIILIAQGTEKAQAVRDMVKGPVSPTCPASILQKHGNVHIFLDNDAASLL